MAMWTAAAKALGKAQGDEAEGRAGVFMRLEPGVSAELVGGVPKVFFEVDRDSFLPVSAIRRKRRSLDVMAGYKKSPPLNGV